jgi:hypothetical protein
VAVLLLRPELVSLCLLALLRFRERSPMSSATTAPAFPCSASSSALRCQQRASSSRSSATARACHGMIAKLSGSQAKPCARLTASVASSSVQNGAVMCNRPGSLGSGCQLGGVASRWTGIQQRTVERQRIEGLAVALLRQLCRVRPGGAAVAWRLAEVADLLPGSVSDSMVESLQVAPPYGTSQLKEVSYVCRQFA